MAFLSGGVAFVVSYNFEKRNERQDKITKWGIVIGVALTGMIVGGIVSVNVGEKIANKHLVSNSTVLETVNLSPFSGSFGAYIVTGENQYGEKVAWYLQEKELFEKPYNDIIDRNMIVFSNTSAPAEQLVRVNVGIFWRWFAVIPIEHRFVIPAGGLQEGTVLKTYKFIPISE